MKTRYEAPRLSVKEGAPIVLFVLFLLAFPLSAQQATIQRVIDDAKAIDRVVEVARDEPPVAVLQRIVREDIDILRGRKQDGTYMYARYEPLEASRTSDSFSVQPTDPDRLTRVEMTGEWAYRAVLEVPSRRLVVAKNRPLFIDHVEIEYIPQAGGPKKLQSVKVGEALAPGTSKSIEFEDVARHATVRVFARAEKESGYGNLAITLVIAKIFDNTDSPYAAAVSSAKAMQQALDRRDNPTVRAMAQRIARELEGNAPTRRVEVVAPAPSSAAAGSPELFRELQSIEDLLTGSESERRQGMDQLHQLIRRMRDQ